MNEPKQNEAMPEPSPAAGAEVLGGTPRTACQPSPSLRPGPSTTRRRAEARRAKAGETQALPRRTVVIIALLIAATFLAYWPAGQCGFVNLDDDVYVEFQPMLNRGFSEAGVWWAFTGSHSGMWHPLTTLSHMLDCELFGLRAAPMHWENVLWHALNGVLVFFSWRLLTGATWRPALVAMLFALHPLHVESVAWISERKDVLCAFFWLLGIIAYIHYVRRPSVARYLLVGLGLVLALLSKPMAVTFPITLLLLDYWPLQRWSRQTWPRLLREKIPFFAIVVLHSVVTFLVQRAAGAADYGQRFPLAARLGNALVSYVRYLGKTIWPDSLAPLYFHPGYWPGWWVLGAAAAVTMSCALAWWQRRNQPWLAFGCLWFFCTLGPAIGLVQVGAQSMADRYTYVPLLGVFTILAWEAAALAGTSATARHLIAGAAALVCAGCLLLTRRQVQAWENSVVLYEHSIARGEDNAAVRYLLAGALRAAGRPEADYVAQYRRALADQPDYINALTQLAGISLQTGRMDEARQLIEKSIRLEPQNPAVHINLGAFYVRLGRPNEAVPHFEQALRLDPASAEAHYELALICMAQNRPEAALAHFEVVARALPWDAEKLCDYGMVLGNVRRLEEARHTLERALWINPDFPRARENLRTVRQLIGRNG